MFKRSLTAAVLAVLTVAPGLCAASADYKVWFDNADAPLGVEVGDITLGNQKYHPPAWACGRRIFGPDHYYWVGEFNNIIQSGDLSSDLNVWMGRPGCNQPLAVKRKSDGYEYVPPLGRHYLRISGAHASLWMNKDGTWPVCGAACSPPAVFKAAVASIDWSSAALVLQAAQDGVRNGSAGAQQARLRLADGLQRTASLQARVAAAVAERRRANWGTLETSVRVLEDHALRLLAEAAAQQDGCRRHWEAGRPADGALACAAARDALALAQRSLQSILDEVR